jgi:hypothetical protein
LPEKLVAVNQTNGFGAFFYPLPVSVNPFTDELGICPGYLIRNITGKIEWENGEISLVTDDGFICVITDPLP